VLLWGTLITIWDNRGTIITMRATMKIVMCESLVL